jgi:hypothetical protein
MRLREAVASALHLLVVLSYFSLAGFAFLLPSRPDWRIRGVNWLQERPESFYWLGAALALVGILFMLGFYGIGRGHFLRISMKPHMATVDAKLLEMAIDECFKINFPDYVRSSGIAILSKQRLEVSVDLMPLEEKLQTRLVRQMERKLGALLRDRFGYSQAFTLSLHSR